MHFYCSMIMKYLKMLSAEVAKALAEGEYEKYRVIQDKLHESDFDELIKASKESEKITTTKTSL